MEDGIAPGLDRLAMIPCGESTGQMCEAPVEAPKRSCEN